MVLLLTMLGDIIAGGLRSGKEMRQSAVQETGRGETSGLVYGML